MTFKEYIEQVEKDFGKKFLVSNKDSEIIKEGFEKMKKENTKWKLIEKAYEIAGKNKDLIFETSQKNLEDRFIDKIYEYDDEDITSETIKEILKDIIDPDIEWDTTIGD